MLQTCNKKVSDKTALITILWQYINQQKFEVN